MVIKEKWRITQFITMAKAYNKPENGFVIKLPFFKYCMAAVYPLDGKAIVIPTDLRCGIMVCDWFAFKRFVKNHNLS